LKTWMISFGLLASALTSLAVNAQPAAKCTEKQSARQLVSAALSNWQATDLATTLQERSDAGNLTLITGDVISVKESTSSTSFGKSRDMAFASSFLNVQAKFVELRGQKIAADTIAETMKGTPSQADMKLDDPSNKDRVIRIGDKLYQLTEAMIDNALRKEGVSEADIAKVEPSKRIETLRNTLTRRTRVQAFGEVAGVLPIQNFEATDCEGRSAVITIAVHSLKNLDFARAVVRKQPIAAQKDDAAPKSLALTVRDEVASKEILRIMNLRKVYDQNGYPSLLSYGQWSYVNVGGTPRDRELREEAAKTQAEANAKANIAFYLNGTASSVVETSVKEVEQGFVNITKDAATTESISEDLEKQFRKLQAKGTVTLSGLRPLQTWTMEYPDPGGAKGVMIIGVVVGWSPLFADAVNKATGSSVRQAVTADAPTSPPAEMPGAAQVSGSKAKNRASDF
jgi:osmotically-inducible protein OsmY